MNTMAKFHGTTEEEIIYTRIVFWDNPTVRFPKRMTGDGELDSAFPDRDRDI